MSQPPNMIQRIQPADVTRLLDALKEELAQAKAAGTDTAKARQHYAKANQIKQVLVNYQQQQKAAAARNASGNSGPSTSASNTGSNMGSNVGSNTASNMGNIGGNPNMGGSANPGANLSNNQPNNMMGGGNFNSGPSGNTGVNTTSSSSGRLGSPPTDARAATVTTEKYNQVRARLQDLERTIRALETGRRPDMSAEEASQLDSQLSELKLKYGQYSKFALYMRNQLMEQARASSPQQSPPAGTPSNAGVLQTGGVAATTGENSAPVAGPAGTAMSASPAAASPAAASPDATKGRSASPATKEPSVPGFNLAGITKPSVPLMPILSTLNVKPAVPVTLKPGANNVRPTLSGGSASGLGQIMGTPAVMRMPTFDMALSGPMPDNGGRVLTKRKLTELVNTMGADDGDGKTTIDGDVEELLLDLADEFVSLVTSFACRLAKHRKTDAVDVRDVQLHLERNWNIRVPGHAMDDIRAVRKWQPSLSYNLKVSGVEIAKAVNGNMN